MSIRVLKAKAQSRRLVAEKNSIAKLPVNLNYSNNSRIQCENNIDVIKAPAPQKSYRNYNRQALLGYSGLASRIVSTRDSQTNEPITIPEGNTFKRMPEFSQSQYLYNLKSCVVRNKDRQEKCSPVSPKCNNDACGKTKISITKPVGYLSAGEYLQRKVARRVSSVGKPYELPQAPAGNGTLTC